MVLNSAPQERGRLGCKKPSNDNQCSLLREQPSSGTESPKSINPIHLDTSQIHKRESLNNIQPKLTIDSAIQTHLLSTSNEINACPECGPNYNLRWKAGGGMISLGSIIKATRTKTTKDNLAIRIWSNMPTKFSILLWKIKSKQITTFTMLRA